MLLGSKEVAIVARAFLGATEGGVGFADLDEALRGAAVVGVEVWVVRFGEFVELSAHISVCREGVGAGACQVLLYLAWGCVCGKVERLVVIGHAVVIVAVEGLVEVSREQRIEGWRT